MSECVRGLGGGERSLSILSVHLYKYLNNMGTIDGGGLL